MPKSDKYIRLEQAGDFADRLSVKAGRGEDATIGECIHQLLCIYQDTPDYQERISNIKTEYGVVLSTDAFMKSARNMYEWLKEKYGEATEILRETPFRYTTEEGQEVTGEIDLIYRTEDGDVLIDYKTYSGKVSEVKAKEGKFSASKYTGQIYSYRNAMEKAGFKVRDSLICYFNLGTMIRIIFK